MPRTATTAAWANSAPINTVVVVTAAAIESHGEGQVLVVIHNPSTITALEITPRIRVLDAGAVERIAIMADTAAYTVAANTTSAKRVPSMTGGKVDLSIRNLTVLGAGDGFTAQVIIQPM